MGQRVILFLASLLGPLLILLYGMTWRVRWSGEANLEAARVVAGKVLYVFWHSRLLGLCYTHRFRNAGLMVSKSFDGEWIARVIMRLGYRAFRGSASRNGASALLEMLKSHERGDLALTVDGPRGPAEKLKAGAIILGSLSGLPLVPITVRSSRAWRLKTWDRFIVPRPFSTVEIIMGRHILIPANIGREQIKRYLRETEAAINEIG